MRLLLVFSNICIKCVLSTPRKAEGDAERWTYSHVCFFFFPRPIIHLTIFSQDGCTLVTHSWLYSWSPHRKSGSETIYRVTDKSLHFTAPFPRLKGRVWLINNGDESAHGTGEENREGDSKMLGYALSSWTLPTGFAYSTLCDIQMNS